MKFDPLLRATNCSPGGGEVCPRSTPGDEAPQQTGVPSERRPQVWLEPLLMSTNRSSGGGEA